MKEILTPGEKIKLLRGKLGLKQEDLSNNRISKSLISMLEQDKRGLTLKSAEIIAESLNKFLSTTGESVTAEYLIEPVTDQINRAIVEDINRLKSAINSGKADEDLVDHIFDNALQMIRRGDFPKELMELKILRGKFYYSTYQYKKAVAEYLDVMDRAIEAKDYGKIAQLYILLGSTYQMQLVMDTALVHYVKANETAVFHSTENKDQVRVYSLFNQISVYRNIKRHDLVFTHIGLFRDLKWADPLYRIYSYRVDLIEANTHRDIENWDRAEVLYKRLMEDKKRLDDETRFLLYNNIGLFYRNKGNKKKALEYIEKAFKMREKVELYYIPALYLYQATCYNLEEEYERVIDLLENALLLADRVAHKRMTIELRFAFAGLFLELKDYGGALQQLAIIDKAVHRSNIRPLLQDLYSYYIDCYYGLGNGDKVSEYTAKIRQRDYLRD